MHEPGEHGLGLFLQIVLLSKNVSKGHCPLSELQTGQSILLLVLGVVQGLLPPINFLQ